MRKKKTQISGIFHFFCLLLHGVCELCENPRCGKIWLFLGLFDDLRRFLEGFIGIFYGFFMFFGNFCDFFMFFTRGIGLFLAIFSFSRAFFRKSMIFGSDAKGKLPRSRARALGGRGRRRGGGGGG